MSHKLDKINSHFQLPIYFNESKMSVSENIINDLELSGINMNESLYNSIFENKDKYAIASSELWSKYYTNDKVFLKDTQRLLKKRFLYESEPSLDCWDKLKGDIDFNNTYQFVDNYYLNFLNKNSLYLQTLCFYKFASPLIALIYPIFLLFIPLVILKYNGLQVSFSQYYGMIKMMLMNNSLVQLFSNFSLTNWRQSVYLLFSAFMYIFGIYQNILSCIRFHFNMKNISVYIVEMTTYLKHNISKMTHFYDECKNLSTYKPFLDNMETHKSILINRLHLFEKVNKYSWDIRNLSNMGYSLKMLYHIYHDTAFNDAVMYSFGFNGFILNIKDIQNNIIEKKINITSFSDKTKFKNAYYPKYKDKEHVKNNYSLRNSLIISGPNASGKTTLIKTTLFNILLSQQIGYGFFSKGSTKLYKYIHSYLNIPDTSDRDSLFQAEARRCREIISVLDANKDENHFCIFDELYSGTNPYEAIASAYGFIKYMLKRNIDFMLTTHFVELCKELNDNKEIDNVQMDISIVNNNIKYLYKLKDGISHHRGGVKVLKQLKYPTEIINDTMEYLDKSFVEKTK
jgi:hypothetical protein